ncbi:MAG TPA: hypothetical protein VK843_04520 [Planctomycetota bacterium]|nr:hypothetical protein [Planctomycetota bacterium]
MSSPSKDYARVLASAEPTTIELARGLLSAAGIPCLEHGPDFDVAELGRAAHDVMRHQDLYVPREALDRALDILEEAWGTRPEVPAAE